MGSPFLHRVQSLPDRFDRTRYPFNVRALSRGIDLEFRSTVTLFVGENGSGKSTLLEALAECCGFNPEGGNRDHHRAAFADRSDLARALRLSWLPKVTEGFFLRAESFYNFATYIDSCRSRTTDERSRSERARRGRAVGPPRLARESSRRAAGGVEYQPSRAAGSPNSRYA